MSKLLRKLGLKKAPVIDYWDCSKLNLYDLPKEVLRHRHTLKSLFINNNHIRDVPKTIFLIEGLEELDISENDILFVPPGISHLTHLTSLVISKNSLANVPDAIRHCEQLLTLDLSINPLGSLCEGLLELRQLRKLILNDTQLEEVPPNIGKLSKLEVLELRENLLQTLPGSMSHLTLLEKLDVGNNEFVTVPTVIGSLESLYELWLDTNTINSIPEELGNLHNLRFLEISENHVMVLPNTMNGWVKLTDLYANENLISYLPDSFGELSSLTTAKLSCNRLGGLPVTVYGLSSLVELDVSHNHITELPPSIGGMTSLVDFNLDENLLNAVPPEIGNCTALKHLSLRDNQLYDVPPECSSLTNLRILNLIGNRLSHLPFALTTLKSLSAIWVAENQSRPIVELQVEKNERGDKWLTCFLFPQQGTESPYEEATSPLDAVADEDPNMRPINRKTSQVNFDPRATDKRSKISRDPTPFPKELHSKAMQWRAARDIQVGGTEPQQPGDDSSNDRHSAGLDEVALRNPQQHRRLVKNRYSLLKALSDPLDEYLNPARGRRLPSGSVESPPPSPAVIPATIRETSHSKRSPSSPLENSRRSKSPTSPIRGGRYSPSANSQTRSTGSDTGSPLPPIADVYSPDGSVVQVVQSGPYLDPPAEFAASVGVPSPISSSTKLYPSQNGGVTQHNLQVGTSEHQIRGGSKEPKSPTRISNTHPNSNGNNNKGGNYRGRASKAPHSISLGMVNEMMHTEELKRDTDPVSPPPLQSVYFPSQASTLSHSDVPETRSSMESGFDADNELESHQAAWYLSPNGSPKSRRRSRENRPKLGPQVVVSPTQPLSPTGSKHARLPSESSHHSGSQMSQHDSVSDDYERLVHHDPYHDKSKVLDHRRGSLDAVVMLSSKEKASTYTYGAQQEYDQAYPVHQPSRSFDATGPVNSRGSYVAHTKRTNISPPSSHHSQSSSHHSQEAHPHYSPRSPISPVSPTTRVSTHSQRAPSSKSQPEKKTHARNHSQPEGMMNAVTYPNNSHSHSHSQPHESSRSPRSPGYPHQKRDKGSVSSTDSVFQTSYPGHKGVLQIESRNSRSPNPPKSPGRHNYIHSSRANNSHISRNGRGRYHSELHSRIVENEPCERFHHHSENLHGYHTSDESTSGRGTPVATPTLGTKSNWVSGNDSGFDSMNRNNRLSEDTCTHPGTQFIVELIKDPTLGLGITGGRDGENAIKPGDTGFHVYKVTEGLPAYKCGKISIGDKLLEVNGYDISSMACEEVLALLTYQKSVSLLLYREPSLTLL